MKKGVYFIDLTLIRFENSPYNFVCTYILYFFSKVGSVVSFVVLYIYIQYFINDIFRNVVTAANSNYFFLPVQFEFRNAGFQGDDFALIFCWSVFFANN